MKRLICYLIAIAVLFPACQSTYYFSTLDSARGQALKTYNGDFLIENDSVSVIYSFNGYNAPVLISIYNKLNKPINVDWQKSFLIVDDVATSLLKKDASFKGYSYSVGITEKEAPRSPRSYSESIGTIEGSFDIPQTADFIPPQSKIEYNGLDFRNISFGSFSDRDYSHITINDKKDRAVKAKGINFTVSNSPLRFRSYLTMYVESVPDKPFVSEQSFYLSRLVKTSLSPNSVSPRLARRGDLFYTEDHAKADSWQYAVAGVGLAGVIWVLVKGFSVDTDIDKPSGF